MAKAAPPAGGSTTSHRGGLNTRLRNAWTTTASGAQRWLHTRTRPQNALPDLDTAYQQQLETLTRVRRIVAGVATSRTRLERQITHLEHGARDQGSRNQAPTADPGQENQEAERQLAELRRQYATLEAEEVRVFAASRSLQAKVEAFRAAKETTENAYTAAEQAAKTTWTEITSNADTDTEGSASPTSQHNRVASVGRPPA